MTRTYARVGDRLTYIGGLPTAETFALPLLQLGVSTYSSALFNFVPAVGDRASTTPCAPRTAQRSTVGSTSSSSPTSTSATAPPGYAVSIVKGGLTAIGRPAGPVRPPLTDLATTKSRSCATSSPASPDCRPRGNHGHPASLDHRRHRRRTSLTSALPPAAAADAFRDLPRDHPGPARRLPRRRRRRDRGGQGQHRRGAVAREPPARGAHHRRARPHHRPAAHVRGSRPPRRPPRRAHRPGPARPRPAAPRRHPAAPGPARPGRGLRRAATSRSPSPRPAATPPRRWPPAAPSSSRATRPTRGTGYLVARAITRAVAECGLPAGIFSLALRRRASSSARRWSPTRASRPSASPAPAAAGSPWSRPRPRGPSRSRSTPRCPRSTRSSCCPARSPSRRRPTLATAYVASLTLGCRPVLHQPRAALPARRRGRRRVRRRRGRRRASRPTGQPCSPPASPRPTPTGIDRAARDADGVRVVGRGQRATASTRPRRSSSSPTGPRRPVTDEVFGASGVVVRYDDADDLLPPAWSRSRASSPRPCTSRDADPTRPPSCCPSWSSRPAASSSTAGRPASRWATPWSTAARSPPPPTPAPPRSAPSRSSASSARSPTRTCRPTCCPRPSATTTRGA